jgi:hypothetical protein
LWGGSTGISNNSNCFFVFLFFVRHGCCQFQPAFMHMRALLPSRRQTRRHGKRNTTNFLDITQADSYREFIQT